MNVFVSLIGFIIHIDSYIGIFIQQYGLLTYLILFIIILLETGLVIAPLLPGDSLLFVSGAFAARGDLNILFLFILLSVAAILGDTINYWIGSYFGTKAFSKIKLFKKEYLEKTQSFYEKHGGKTIIYARFIPIVRTFAPFVAGLGNMRYKRFLSFNIIGGILWVFIFLLAGYYFGGIPIIRDNLSIVIILIIILSLVPAIIEFLRNRKNLN